MNFQSSRQVIFYLSFGSSYIKIYDVQYIVCYQCSYMYIIYHRTPKKFWVFKLSQLILITYTIYTVSFNKYINS